MRLHLLVSVPFVLLLPRQFHLKLLLKSKRFFITWKIKSVRRKKPQLLSISKNKIIIQCKRRKWRTAKWYVFTNILTDYFCDKAFFLQLWLCLTLHTRESSVTESTVVIAKFFYPSIVTIFVNVVVTTFEKGNWFPPFPDRCSTWNQFLQKRLLKEKIYELFVERLLKSCQ